MGQVKEISINNRTYYFFNDMINTKVFDSNLLKIEKTLYKNVDIYYTGYITINKIDNYENIYCANPLYLIIGKVNGHIEEKNGSKYLVFDSTDENRQVLKNTHNSGMVLRNEIKTINEGKEGEYGKDFMKIMFDTDDNLLLNKPLKLRMLAIIVRSVFQEHDTFYPQVYLDELLYES